MFRRDFPKALIALAAGGASAADSLGPCAAVVDPREYGAVGDGVADDTSALQAALAARAASGVTLVLPSGRIFRITRYVELYGNTTVVLLGTIRLANRSSGLFTNGGANVSILGLEVGMITSEEVQSQYRFNTPEAAMAPAIHLRSARNVAIRGVNISHCQQGILISNAAETMLRPGHVRLTQTEAVNCRVQDCNIRFCEMSGIASFNALDSGYTGNYVFRCGDGGMWMMGAKDCEIVDNHRISPYAVPADVATHGPNSPDHPRTWNDEQGIELENCHGVRVAANVVKGMWGIGIDIKNGCDRVVVVGNRVDDCENASICVRDGDAVRNACHQVAIVGNAVSGHGMPHYGRAMAQRGAIRAGECFISDVTENVIYGYRGTPGIVCEGPGDYQERLYPRNPHQGSLEVRGNRIEFKSDAFELERTPQLGSETLSAISIQGQYDSVKCDGNCITADRYLAVDRRLCAAPAISLRQVAANGSYYPTCASISGNQISGWGNWGIAVVGLPQMQCSGVAVCGNSIGALAGGGGIHLAHLNRSMCSQNMINQIVAGTGYAAIWLEGSAQHAMAETLVCGNQIMGGWSEGGNAMTYGLRFDHCAGCNATGNAIASASVAEVGVFHPRGPIVLSGTTGFPRRGRESPNGRVEAHYPGEMYYDDSDGSWWLAADAASRRWVLAGP